MDTGDWIALGSAVVALAAVFIALLSWRAAHRSAAASERAAAAAERSAQAEERTVALAEQTELARDAPVFQYTPKGRSGGTDTYMIATLVVGPPEVDVKTTGVWIWQEGGAKVGTSFDLTTSRLNANGTHATAVDLRSWATAVKVEVHLECTEVRATSPRRWTRIGTVEFDAPPVKPVSVHGEPPPRPARGLFRDLGSNY